MNVGTASKNNSHYITVIEIYKEVGPILFIGSDDI